MVKALALEKDDLCEVLEVMLTDRVVDQVEIKGEVNGVLDEVLQAPRFRAESPRLGVCEVPYVKVLQVVR